MAARSLPTPAWVHRAGDGGRASSRRPCRCTASASASHARPTTHPYASSSSSLALALRRAPPPPHRTLILHDPSPPTCPTRRRSATRRHATSNTNGSDSPDDDGTAPLSADELVDTPAAAAPTSWLPTLRNKLASVRDDPELQSQLERLARVRKQLVPMSVLFFCMASINTFLDSTKDVLVVTMSGGGAEVRVL